MVDAGGSDAFWPHGLKWALRTAQMLADYDVAWFEEALSPTRSTTMSSCAGQAPCRSPAARC